MAKKDKESKHQSKSKGNGKAKRVLVNFILDKSGSMSSVLHDTIGGFNTYVKELKKEKGVEYSFSLTLFDTQVDNRHVAISLADVPEMTTANYRPDGYTALHDAIGLTVRKVEDDQPKVDKVLTVISTDGEENSSREWTLTQVNALIKEKEAEGNWTFVFLGSQPNSWAVGQAMGMAHANTIRYDPSVSASTRYATMAMATNTYSAGLDNQTRSLMSRVPMRKLARAGLHVGKKLGSQVKR